MQQDSGTAGLHSVGIGQQDSLDCAKMSCDTIAERAVAGSLTEPAGFGRQRS